VGFADERDLAERALALAEVDDGPEPVFPQVAARFVRARESAGLTPAQVAAAWGEPPSMYWDLELYDDEAFDVISVHDLVTLAAILRVSVVHVLFGEEPSAPLPVTSYSEVARRLRAKMEEAHLSIDELSDRVGWDLAPLLDDPDELAELPISGLRVVCRAADVDWATTLANAHVPPDA